MWRRAWIVAAVAATTLVGCSDDPLPAEGTAVPSGPTTSAVDQSAAVPVPTALPIVDQIRDAVAALDAELGVPGEYFEINATARLINLWVALNDGAVAQPWVYLDGVLTPGEGQPAGGGTFTASDLDFDDELVLSKVLAELPGSSVESFYIHGDGNGNVQYSALLVSAKGGGLDIVVGPEGDVLSADPINPDVTTTTAPGTTVAATATTGS
ncbi:MAG: hypothetical protein Q7V88_01480 [Actinomycetota bacterium]|nr:hypothetical protein [Actinomycetota bacterium]